MIKNPISKLLGGMHLIEPGSAAKGVATKAKYPGVRDAIDGNTAVILVEREASDAAGAYPITDRKSVV
jgi:pyruvate-ferredoxin/flavodoxin oxidoreductase